MIAVHALPSSNALSGRHISNATMRLENLYATLCLTRALLRTCSYSADPLLFLPDVNLILLSISKLVHRPSLLACN